MFSKRFLSLCMALTAGIVLLNLTGCTIVFQKGRKSDIERIQSLEEEVNRLSGIKAELESKLKGI